VILALSASTGETALSGRPDEYLELASILEQGRGTMSLDDSADVTPFDVALSAIVVSESAGDPGISSAVEGTALAIRGPLASLAVLAEVLRDSAHAGDPEGHVHVEYFPGHDYLTENSVPLTIADARP
jgi:hypothetical protein